MKHKGLIRGAGAAVGIIFLVMVAAACYLRTEAFMTMAGSTASEKAKELLGVQVDVGSIRIDSLHSLSVKDIAIYDKQAECIARAENARVSFRLLSVLQEDPVAAVDSVELQHVEAYLVERDSDGHWNFEDIETKSEGETTFRGKVSVEDAVVVGRRQGKELTLSQVTASLDMADAPVMKISAEAENQGAKVKANGTVDMDRQIVSVEASGLDVKKYLPFLPEGTIPENVKILSGIVQEGKLSLLRQYGTLSLCGEAKYENGTVQVEGTKIENIHGTASFTEKDLLLSADAESSGQGVHVNGKLRFDMGVPYMDLEARSDSFDPGEILHNLPFHGAVKFQVHVKGVFRNPSVEADLEIPLADVEGISVRDASARVRLEDNTVYVQKLRGGIFGGTVQEGEGELRLDDLGYTAHVKAENLDAEEISEYVPDASGFRGRLFADLGISGIGAKREQLSVYGSVSAREAAYRDLPISSLDASVFMQGEEIKIDYLSLQMPNHSDVGLEGEIHGEQLDLSFYGAHVDLSLASRLLPQADMTGYADFSGRVKGDFSNPRVGLKLSCLNGTLFRQPFDTLRTVLGGSLNGVGIRSFFMEKDGKEVWQVKGYAGFVGEKRMDIQVDTAGARMEDIVALVAPEQDITGNVDNIIHLTGTLDHPKAVGFVKLHRGSYNGILLTGAEGDYFLDGSEVRLQDFHVFSPMFDFDVNGTLDMDRRTLDMKMSVHDIDMKRVGHSLPYEVSGHGTFEGEAKGTFDKVDVYGVLDAPQIVLNGQELQKVQGHVETEGNWIHLSGFGFRQGNGTYSMEAGYNMESEELAGRVEVENADICALSSILNQKQESVQGSLSAQAVLGGTLENPAMRFKGTLNDGMVCGYSLHDVDFQGSFKNHVFHVDRLGGEQGTSGAFEGQAVIDMNGPMEGKLSAHDIDMDVFAKLASGDISVAGTCDMELSLGGTVSNPSVDLLVTGKKGGIRGVSFDLLQGELSLKNGLITVKNLSAQKAVADTTYSFHVDGILPLRAFSASREEVLNDYEQMRLNLYLDDASLALLPVFSSHIDWALGDIDGNLQVTGTLAHPLIHGAIQVPEGNLKIEELEKPLTDMKIDLVFNGTEYRIAECSGKMGAGTYSIQGSLVMDGLEPSKYDLDVVADGLDIQSSAFRGPLNAAFSLREGEAQFVDKTFYLPKLTGKIDLQHCMISIPTIPESEGELPEILLDCSLNVGDDVHFYSPYLCDMYLAGTVQFAGTARHPSPSGSIEVLPGGTLNYLKTVFKIREGEIHFNQVGSFLPSLSLFADTRLSQARVYLWANGPIGNDTLQFVLTSSPEMSQTEIMQMLTLRDAYRNGGDINMGELLTLGLQMSVLSEVESAMRDLLYLDVLSISRGDGSAFASQRAKADDGYTLTMGKYISDKVMLKYTHGFGSSDVRRIGILYDLNDRVGLSVERDRNETIFGVEARFKF